MEKEELIKKLTALQSNGDLEEAHMKADQLLLKYINDVDISIAFNDIDKWYA